MQAKTEPLDVRPHVARMLIERYELADKVNKLRDFVGDRKKMDVLDVHEGDDLIEQLDLMQQYLQVLERRIRRADAERSK